MTEEEILKNAGDTTRRAFDPIFDSEYHILNENEELEGNYLLESPDFKSFSTGLTELINLIQADFQKKQDWVQFPEMPAAADYPGKVVQFTGVTDADFTKGFFYYSTGLEWTMISVASAVEVVGRIPDWSTAKDGIIYYVTSESACYIRNSSVPGEWLNIAGGDNAAFEIVSSLPAWDAANPKMIYIAVSGDEVTTFVRSSTPGKWYQLSSNTVKAFEIVANVPAWVSAAADVIYMVPNGTTLKAYIKNVNIMGSFYSLGSESKTFEVVTVLPAWTTADENIIYFLIEDGKLIGNIKNPALTDAWYTIGGETAKIEYLDTLPDYADAEIDTLYVVNESGILSLYTKAPADGKFNALLGHEGIPIDDIDGAFNEIFN